MKPQPLATLAILAFVLAPTAAGQRLPSAGFPRFRPQLSAQQQPDTAPKPAVHASGDYTWDGVIVGSFVFGALGLWASQLCSLGDHGGGCAMIGTLGGVTIGAAVGGMIGSGKKRTPRPPPSDSVLAPMPTGERPPVPVRADSALFPRARTHGGNGAALGAGIAGGTLAIFATLFCDPGRNCALKALKYGALGAGVGGILGAWASATVQSSEQLK